MIERLFARWLSERITGKPIEGYPKPKVGLFGKMVGWIFYSWFFIGLFISYVAYEYGLDSTQCDLCNQLVKQMPSIAIAATKSDYPQVMRIIWLYLTITTPLAALAFILTIPLQDFDMAPPTSLKMAGLSLLLACVFIYGSYDEVFISVGGIIDETPTRLKRLWIHSIWGGYGISFAYFGGVPIGILFLVLYIPNFVCTQFSSSLNRKHHG